MVDTVPMRIWNEFKGACLGKVCTRSLLLKSFLANEAMHEIGSYSFM